MNKLKEELKRLEPKALQEKVDELRQDLFKLRLASFSAPVKDHTQFKRLKRNIARALTYLRQKGISA